MRERLSCSLGFALLLAACGGGGNGPQDSGPSDNPNCNPLAGGSCLLPWPSSAYLDTDSATATGFHVAIPREVMPKNVNDIVLEPAGLERWDGFSPNSVIVVGFATGVSQQGLPPATDPARSVAADSPIILLNMATGERVPFFAEIDQNLVYPEDKMLLIRPLVRMAGGARHLVAIRKAVKAADGSDLPIAPAFQAMVDGTTFDHPLMDKLAPGYPAIFTALEQQGVQSSDLVLAWDFVTASDEMLTSDLLTMRDLAMPVLHDHALDLAFTAAVEPGRGNPAYIMTFLIGTYQAPQFLDNETVDGAVGKLVRDATTTKPVLQGLHEANFGAVIPNCVATTRPVPVIVFGHGLFGNGAESLDNGFLQEVAEDYCVIFVAGDFTGLTQANFNDAAFAANDLNKGEPLIDTLAQSVIDFIALAQQVKGPMAQSADFSYMGEAVIDPGRVYYYGASLGGIMGNTFMAYEPEITRGALGVPGGNWSLMFERSFAWPALQVALRGSYPDMKLQELMTAFFGMQFDRVDPITTSHRVIQDPLPGTPAKQLFLYEGVGDCLVTNLATEMVARQLGIPVTGPSLYVPYGLSESTDPVPSGLTIYDEHPTPLPPDTNASCADENGTHGDVNERPAVQRQVQGFLLSGTLTHECRDAGGQPAPCDCATTACD